MIQCGRMARIVILLHRHGVYEPMGYLIEAISQVWRQNGDDVRVSFGPGERAEGDVCIQHVDLTRVPDDHTAYATQFPIQVNVKTTDISKSVYSDRILSREHTYDGPVIVKTDRNCRGMPEFRLETRGLLESAGYRPIRDYPVYESLRAVPNRAWETPGLIVERFVAERRDGFYCLRTWVFLGDRETNSLSYSREPVVKAANIVRREVVSEVPEELRKTRREMGFDFGKFDYAIEDGKVVLYDVNRTPSFAPLAPDITRASAERLAGGLKAFL